MSLLQLHNSFFHIYQTTPLHPSISPRHFVCLEPKFRFKYTSLSLHKPIFKLLSLSKIEASIHGNEEEQEEETNNGLLEFEDLAPDGVVYQKTLRLVECSMFAAVTGLVYFLSNSLAIALTHGLVGFTMGSLWRFDQWVLLDHHKHSCFSHIRFCCHDTIPSMNFIYALFGTLAWDEVYIEVASLAGEGSMIALGFCNLCNTTKSFR